MTERPSRSDARRIDRMVEAAGALDDEAWERLLDGPLPSRGHSWRGVLRDPDLATDAAVATEIAATPPPVRDGRWRRPVALVAAVLVLVAVATVLATTGDRGPARRRQVVAAPPPTTASGTPDGSPRVLEHLPAAGDRSASLVPLVSGLDATVADATPDASSVRRVLQVGEVFPPGYLPELDPLPTRATWVFSNETDKAGGRCTEYQPAPLTMDGFAALGYLGQNTFVSIVTYTFSSEADAGEFFSGRSMLLGTDRADCDDSRRRPAFVHRDVALADLPPSVEDWNSWAFTDRFLWLGESSAFGALARVGDRLVEARVGLIDPGALSPERTARLLSDLVGRVAG